MRRRRYAEVTLWRSSTAFTTGMLIGGCVVALIGGICGASMVGTSFH